MHCHLRILFNNKNFSFVIIVDKVSSSTTLFRPYLEPAEDLWQLGERVFLVDELLPVEVPEARAVEGHAEVRAEHSLAVQLLYAGERLVQFAGGRM